MARKPKELPPYEVDIVEREIDLTPREGHYEDPLAPMPGGVRLIPEQRTPPRGRGELAAAKGLYQDYAKALHRFRGDEVSALADVLGISPEEAQEKKHELHRRITEPVSSGRSLQEIFKEMDVPKEARIYLLRMHAYSDVPAASLKAIEMLNNMDSARIQDVTSYEHYVRSMLNK